MVQTLWRGDSADQVGRGVHAGAGLTHIGQDQAGIVWRCPPARVVVGANSKGQPEQLRHRRERAMKEAGGNNRSARPLSANNLLILRSRTAWSDYSTST
jgi:hypothetical protein